MLRPTELHLLRDLYAGVTASGHGLRQQQAVLSGNVRLLLDAHQLGLAISYQLSAISYQLSAISFQLSAFSYQLSAFSYQLSAFSYQLSVIRVAGRPTTEGRGQAVRAPGGQPVEAPGGQAANAWGGMGKPIASYEPCQN